MFVGLTKFLLLKLFTKQLFIPFTYKTIQNIILSVKYSIFGIDFRSYMQMRINLYVWMYCVYRSYQNGLTKWWLRVIILYNIQICIYLHKVKKWNYTFLYEFLYSVWQFFFLRTHYLQIYTNKRNTYTYSFNYS